MVDEGLFVMAASCLKRLASFNPTMVDEGLNPFLDSIRDVSRFNPTMVDEKGENNDERSL